MILAGTAAGRIFGFDPSKRSIELRLGTAAINSQVVGINFASADEDIIYYSTRSGGVMRVNIYDSFDYSEFFLKDALVHASQYHQGSSRVLVGLHDGKIHAVKAGENFEDE